MNENFEFKLPTHFVEKPSKKSTFSAKPIIKLDRSQYSDKEVFCAILGRHTDSKQGFSDLVMMFNEVNVFNLVGQLKPAVNDIDGYYETSLAFKDIDDEELGSMTASTKQRKENNTFAGAKKAVWNAGLPAVQIGDDPFNHEFIHSDELINESLSNKKNVVTHAVFAKKSNMLNSYKSVLKAIPAREQAELRNDRAKIETVEAMIDDFDNGVMKFNLSPDQYSPPKEPGVSLPHTLSPREWVTTTTSHLVNHLYGKEFLLGVRDKDMQDVRRCQGGPGDYFTFDDDPGSAFSLDVSPSLYCDRVDSDGNWLWRVAGESIKLQVNQMMIDGGHSLQNSKQREIFLKQIQREHALKMKGDAADALRSVSNLPYLKVIDPDVVFLAKDKKYALLLFKAGLSKLDDVYENEGYLHLVSKENAKNVEDSSYYKILYPDMNTVLLLPLVFWETSRWATTKKTSSYPYLSPYGLKLPRLDYSAIGLYLAMFQLSHTKKMFQSWGAGKAYDHAAHTKKLSEVLSNSTDRGFMSLFPSGFGGEDISKISKYLNLFIRMFPGSVSGLWIAPALSKQGKASIKVMQRNAGYVSEVDAYNMDLENELGLSDPFQFNFEDYEIVSEDEFQSVYSETSSDSEAPSDIEYDPDDQ